MSDTHKEEKSTVEQSEAHTNTPMPIYEFQVPIYGSEDENSTSVPSGEYTKFELGRISINNLNV